MWLPASTGCTTTTRTGSGTSSSSVSNPLLQGTSSFRITRTLFASCTPSEQEKKLANKKTPSKQDQLGIEILRKDFAEVRHFENKSLKASANGHYHHIYRESS